MPKCKFVCPKQNKTEQSEMTKSEKVSTMANKIYFSGRNWTLPLQTQILMSIGQNTKQWYMCACSYRR